MWEGGRVLRKTYPLFHLRYSLAPQDLNMFSLFSHFFSKKMECPIPSRAYHEVTPRQLIEEETIC